GNDVAERFPLAGGTPPPVDPSGGTALALDPQTGNLYVNHGNNVVIYDAAGVHIDSLFSLGTTTNSRGIAYYSTGKNNSAGKRDLLFVPDPDQNLVANDGPPAAGARFITAESPDGAGKTSRIL